MRVHTYAGVRVHGYNTDLGKHASLVDIVGYSPEVEQAARRGATNHKICAMNKQDYR